MTSLKIFRPWDVPQNLTNTIKYESINNNEIIHQTIPENNVHNHQTSRRCISQRDDNIAYETSKSGGERSKITFYENNMKYIASNKSDENTIERKPDARTNEMCKKISDTDTNDKFIVNEIKQLEDSSDSNEIKDPCDSTSRRRHSRKHHRSKSRTEKSQKTHSPSSTSANIKHYPSLSPTNVDKTLLSQDPMYQTEINFSNIEKHFYPDFRSLEFLPEDILDPILMSGLPLGAPLDPYWSNLALEYFKSHEQNLKSKHQRPKKFNCPHCNVAFSNNGQLKGHIRIHTGERPFKCDAESCGKSFTRNEELTRHKRIHSGLRPYPCTQCGKKFGRKDHLKKHLRTHFPQPRFVPYYSPYVYGGYTSVVL